MSQEPEDQQQTTSLQKLVKNLIFLPFVQFPPLPIVPDLSDPGKYDLTNTSHLFISSPVGTMQSNSRIGAWLMLPETSSGKVEPLKATDTIVLYLHGNAHNRGQKHRVGLYKVYVNLGFHVLAIDYRGYGDSSPIKLNETSVVQARIIVHGHSLGTAIATHMVAEYDLESGGNSKVDGLILEAPFNNILTEVMTYKMARAFSYWFDMREQLAQSNTLFETDHWLPAVRCPVLILHAEDDYIVPFNLGEQLFEEGKKAKENIAFIRYDGGLRLGHCNIFTAPTLPDQLTDFVMDIKKAKPS